MNERIRELAHKVDRIRDLYNIGPVHRDAVEQFAELIVRECISNLEFHGHDAAVDQLEWFRRKHFGVE